MSFSRTSASSLLQRVQQKLSNPPVELIYTPHDRWPITHPPLVHRPLRMLVLDSSYNPPTSAHLALAKSRRPSYSKLQDSPDDDSDYDAKLLLLSVRNADKTMKPGDASYLQRLEMMTILANDVVRNLNSTSNDDDDSVTPREAANAAIGIIDEPTFVGKSRSLLAFLKDRFTSFASTTPPSLVYDTQLTFMVGFDTFERLILPRYYASESQMLSSLRKFFSPAPDGDDSRIVCARRGPSVKDSEVTADNDVKLVIAQEFISSERIVFIDIGEDVRTYSSTAVRDAISRPDSDAEDWRTYVPREIAEYIVREGLYTN
jgi:nicotinamide-nucleotide adenylyltransferase